MKRNIIKIDEDKCNGCGNCVTGCAEGALAIVNGKAKLIKESYCDGLGACIGDCPVGALKIESRECDDFDEEAVKAAITKKDEKKIPLACPGMKSFDFSNEREENTSINNDTETVVMKTELEQWPVMLRLLSPAAPYLKDKDLSLLSTCSAVTSPDVQWRFIRGKSVAVACPKLDDTSTYADKLAEMINSGGIKSLTVIRMEVPCCAGLSAIALEARTRSGIKDFPLAEVTLSLRGKIINKKQF